MNFKRHFQYARYCFIIYLHLLFYHNISVVTQAVFKENQFKMPFLCLQEESIWHSWFNSCFTGMLSRWDDSQRFLSDHPYLVCEETAKYLILWCFHLEAEQVSCETWISENLSGMLICSPPPNYFKCKQKGH